MDSLFLLIPIALALVSLAFWVFLWAVKNGQFEDLDTESKRILFDDEAGEKSAENTPSALNQTNSTCNKHTHRSP